MIYIYFALNFDFHFHYSSHINIEMCVDAAKSNISHSPNTLISMNFDFFLIGFQFTFTNPNIISGETQIIYRKRANAQIR